jgi:hypothetical protein
MPRYNTRSTALNASRPPVPAVLAPSTVASPMTSTNKSYAEVAAGAAPAPIVATPPSAPYATAMDDAVCHAASAPIVTDPGVSAPLTTIDPPITIPTFQPPSYAAVVTGTVVPNAVTVNCNPPSNGVPTTVPIITPTNDDQSRVAGNSPPSPLDVLLDAAALAADSPLATTDVAEADRLFASQLFDEDAAIPTFNLENFQPDLKGLEEDEVDDASSCNGDLPVFIDTNRPEPKVPDNLALAAGHVNTADLTDGARFALGTTNHTRKYTVRKKALLSEFVNVLKKNEQKYARFLVLTTEVPSTFPSAEPVEMVFILLRGEENKPDKIRSLNMMLIDWVEAKRLKVPQKNGNEFPAPSSLNTMVRTFLASTKDYYQWSFSQKDFGFDGGYNGFFAALCEKRRKLDVS